MFTRRSTYAIQNDFQTNIYMLTQWICVLPHVGGFQLSKLVSILSNETKRVEVAFTHIHKA